jgi:fructokinase
MSRAGFARLGEARIMEGLRFGQALAAVNCQYEGARGPMYDLSSAELFAQAQKILKA